jgi:hypothetical protein
MPLYYIYIYIRSMFRLRATPLTLFQIKTEGAASAVSISLSSGIERILKVQHYNSWNKEALSETFPDHELGQ